MNAGHRHFAREDLTGEVFDAFLRNAHRSA